MTTKKFWCHYIGSDGNTPKRRNIELTDINELLPTISNEGAKTPLWYEKEDDEYGQSYYFLYAQLSDKVAVKIHQGGLNSHDVERLLWTDEEIVERNNKWLSELLADYPDMSEERKERERQACKHYIDSDRQMKVRYAERIKNLQDYDNYLLDGAWISGATLRAYQDAESGIWPVLEHLRNQALAERERKERERREEARRRAEEEARRKAEADRQEQERLTQEAERFRQGESISGSDVVDLCRRYSISIHLRTVHNLQQVIANINGKEGTCQYYRQSGKRRPQLDGCYKTAGELYNYLQNH